MRRAHPILRVVSGVLAGIAASVAIVLIVGVAAARPELPRLVPEDASGRLRRVAIHYVPAMNHRAMPVWRQLFRVLPADIAVEVAVSRAPDFDQLIRGLGAAGVDHLDRFRAVVVGKQLTTWSRDRMAALATAAGGGILAPPRVSTPTGGRAGDWDAPFALARDVYRGKPRIAGFVFEGGDLAASRRHVFADANLLGRNLGRGDATRAHLESELARTFAQDIIWLGDAQGEVPEHHIMMYMVPLDDHRVLVGDARLGRRLLAGAPLSGSADSASLDLDPDFDLHASRFDRAAALLAARGFQVERIPVVVLRGAGSYVTYTNALFDRDAAGPIVYLPTYSLPDLDQAAAATYRSLGFRVIPIDVTSIYTLNGSLGCLVNVMARD